MATMTMNLKPMADRLVVEPVAQKEKTAGGLYLPDSAKEKPMTGKVIACGPGKRSEQGVLIPMDVKVGDKVLFGKYAGTEITVSGETYMMMQEREVLGVFEA